MPTLLSRLFASFAAPALLLLFSSPAYAQFRPRPMTELVPSEQFHIEVSAALWRPTADIGISSESLGISGTTIDFKKDLGLTDHNLGEFKLTLQPVLHHKLRAQVIPMNYDSSTRIMRDIIFNGQRYSLNLPVTSTFEWKQYRFNYQFDFIAKSRGFAGFIIEARYNDVGAELNTTSPSIHEFTQARFWLPAFGGIGRVYVVPSVSITGEVTGLKIAGSIGDLKASDWIDVDIYGTANFNRFVGAQFGFRSANLGYQVKADSGSLTFKGIYFGVVARY
jgi:hypothetical protein